MTRNQMQLQIAEFQENGVKARINETNRNLEVLHIRPKRWLKKKQQWFQPKPMWKKLTPAIEIELLGNVARDYPHRHNDCHPDFFKVQDLRSKAK